MTRVKSSDPKMLPKDGTPGPAVTVVPWIALGCRWSWGSANPTAPIRRGTQKPALTRLSGALTRPAAGTGGPQWAEFGHCVANAGRKARPGMSLEGARLWGPQKPVYVGERGAVNWCLAGSPVDVRLDSCPSHSTNQGRKIAAEGDGPADCTSGTVGGPTGTRRAGPATRNVSTAASNGTCRSVSAPADLRQQARERGRAKVASSTPPADGWHEMV